MRLKLGKIKTKWKIKLPNFPQRVKVMLWKYRTTFLGLQNEFFSPSFRLLSTFSILIDTLFKLPQESSMITWISFLISCSPEGIVFFLKKCKYYKHFFKRQHILLFEIHSFLNIFFLELWKKIVPVPDWNRQEVEMHDLRQYAVSYFPRYSRFSIECSEFLKKVQS